MLPWTSASILLCVASAVLVFAAVASALEGNEQVSLTPRAPLFDYDCVAVRQPSLVDWGSIYQHVKTGVDEAQGGKEFPRPPPTSGRIFFHHRARALKECPLAVLTMALLHFYTALREPDESDDRDEVLTTSELVADDVLRAFPMHQICASRWPVFEVLEIFALRLRVSAGNQDSQFTCDDVEGGVVNWAQFRRQANVWAESRFLSLGSKELDDLEDKALDSIMLILKKDSGAQWQCEFGFTFSLVSQALSPATRLTQHFTDPSIMLDGVIRQAGFRVIASCGWPIASALAWLSDANKGTRYVVRDPKYLRRFGDLDSRASELSPMVPPPGRGRAAAQRWRERGARRAMQLASLPQHRFENVISARMRRGSPVRKILQDAFVAVVAATRARSSKMLAGVQPTATSEQSTLQNVWPRAVAMTLLYGKSWSPLLGRIVRHLRTLGFAWPLLVVSIGAAASQACRQAARSSFREPPPQVACWSPPTSSQMHRFTIIHILLHLGVDVFFFDMDIFFFHNPLPLVLAQAARDRLDILFASHGDGDCINIGIFLLRCTLRTIVWFSQFLEWYHDHQYEIDQRGLDVLMRSPLRIPDSQLGVSFPPRDLTKVRAGVLEDENMFVIGFIGWAGDMSRMIAFHWCNMPLQRKWEELAKVYDAAEACEGFMPISLAISIAEPGWRPEPRVQSADPEEAPVGDQQALTGTWPLVRRARRIFEAYRLPVPLRREPCW